MRTGALFIVSALIFAFSGCKKERPLPISANIPNADFEGWSSTDYLQNWSTNSCPLCLPPYNTYTVQKTTEAYHGQYAVKLIYNGVYSAMASSKFAVSNHPSSLMGYAKCQILEKDTVSVKVMVYNQNAIVDSGTWINTEPITSYRQFIVPISQNSTHADSVKIIIKGGSHAIGTALWADYLSLH
jgi:hypothetical protein